MARSQANRFGSYYIFARAKDNSGLESDSSGLSIYTTISPPRNDDFTNRLFLAGAAVSALGENSEATLEPDDPAVGSKSVWWSWRAPDSRPYTITAVGLPGEFLPLVGVYTGSVLNNLSLVRRDEINALNEPYKSRVTIETTAGVDYAIAVTSVGGYGGGLSLEFTPTAPPTVVITNPVANATFYVGEPITVTAKANDSDGVVTNVVFYVDDSPSGSSTNEPFSITFTPAWGPAYVRLHARATDNWGVTTVSSEVWYLVTLPPPANDNFANRTSISGESIEVTGDNSYASAEPGDPTTGDKSVWWSWRAPATRKYSVTAEALPYAFYTFLGVYIGSTLEDLALEGSDAFMGAEGAYAARVVFDAIEGMDYAIMVNNLNDWGGAVFSLKLAPGVPPTIKILSPGPDSVFLIGDSVNLAVEALDSDGVITNVTFYVDEAPIESFTNGVASLNLKLTDGRVVHRFQATATDNWGVTSISTETSFMVNYPPPVNDRFGNRITLEGFETVTNGNNQYGTRETNDPASGDNSIWWSWMAPASGTYIITAVPSNYAPVFLDVFTGSELTNLVLVTSGQSESAGGIQRTRCTLNATMGITYAVCVSSAWGGDSINLCILPENEPSPGPRFEKFNVDRNGVCELQLRTGDFSNWRLQMSTNSERWVSTYYHFPPKTLAVVSNTFWQGSRGLFFRLRIEP